MKIRVIFGALLIALVTVGVGVVAMADEVSVEESNNVIVENEHELGLGYGYDTYEILPYIITIDIAGRAGYVGHFVFSQAPLYYRPVYITATITHWQRVFDYTTLQFTTEVTPREIVPVSGFKVNEETGRMDINNPYVVYLPVFATGTTVFYIPPQSQFELWLNHPELFLLDLRMRPFHTELVANEITFYSILTNSSITLTEDLAGVDGFIELIGTGLRFNPSSPLGMWRVPFLVLVPEILNETEY